MRMIRKATDVILRVVGAERIEHQERIETLGLANLVGIDRSTAALVIGKLEAAGYIQRVADADDKRRKILSLTTSGNDILKRVAEPARRAAERALEIFSAEEALHFVQLLDKFVGAFNEDTRAPIIGEKITG